MDDFEPFDPPARCQTCWHTLGYCNCVTFRLAGKLQPLTPQERSAHIHPSSGDDGAFTRALNEYMRRAQEELVARMDDDFREYSDAIFQLMSGGLAHDRDVWVAQQTENLDDELRDLLS